MTIEEALLEADAMERSAYPTDKRVHALVLLAHEVRRLNALRKRSRYLGPFYEREDEYADWADCD